MILFCGIDREFVELASLLYGRVAVCAASNGLLARLFQRLCIVVFFVRECGLR